MMASISTSSITPILILITVIKVLLIPSYFSTDFHVHRNWLATTRHLPLNQWYFDDVGGRTVHTLDYPPGFGWFEYLLGSNFITDGMVKQGWLDTRCLELLPDDDNEPSERCVLFHRCTVILSDVVLFLGAYFASITYGTQTHNGKEATKLSFFLIITNPGLIMLDHIHFQYNGMLLGMLLCSVACIIRGSLGGKTTRKKDIAISEQNWELCGAAFFAVLVSLKHLYMTLAPLYFVYLLRHHCFIAKKENDSTTLKFSFKRFLSLAAVTLICLFGPFVPFLIQKDPMHQIAQILHRLFPFGRGLVHDYWAANIWAIYLFTSRIASFLLRKSFVPTIIRDILESYSLVPFLEPPPHIVALYLLMGLVPALIYSWNAAERALIQRSNTFEIDFSIATFFIHAVVFSAFSAFMLGYHVHEKAIMTAIVPLTLLATTSIENARLFIRSSMFGIFGIFPLLFQPEELLVKSFLYVTWMLLAIHGVESSLVKSENDKLLTTMDTVSITVLSCVFIFMEIIHPIVFMPTGRLEFLPLMTTSVVCFIGLFYCWIQSGVLMAKCLTVKAKYD